MSWIVTGADATPGSGPDGQPWTPRSGLGTHDTELVSAPDRGPGAGVPPPEQDDPLARQLVKRALFPRRALPVKIGRFTVLQMIGRGGMGIVYACYDDLLDRKVAVKVLHSEGRRHHANARLQREAQALARLNHPNVVAVHDVGTYDAHALYGHGAREGGGQGVFLVMDYIEGVTLERWLAERPRSWREVVAAFLAAGHGLVAAHAAGVIHRDFKPSNVLVRADGSVHVFDFGLARSWDGSPVIGKTGSTSKLLVGGMGAAGKFYYAIDVTNPLKEPAVVLGGKPEGGERPKAVLGRDTRASGEMLEAALAAGLNSAGVDVVLVGQLPTPAVAMLSAQLGANFGVGVAFGFFPGLQINLTMNVGDLAIIDLSVDMNAAAAAAVVCGSQITVFQPNATFNNPTNVANLASSPVTGLRSSIAQHYQFTAIMSGVHQFQAGAAAPLAGVFTAIQTHTTLRVQHFAID